MRTTSLQSPLTLCDTMDCSLPGSSVHGDSPDKNTGVGSHSLLWGIFPTQGSNPTLLHCRQILYHLSHQTNPSLVSNTQGKPCPWDDPALFCLKVLSEKAQGSQENSLLSIHTHLAEQVSENSPYPLFGIFHFSGSAGAPNSFLFLLPHQPLKCPIASAQIGVELSLS